MYVEALFNVRLGAESLFSTKCLVTSAGTQVTSEEGARVLHRPTTHNVGSSGKTRKSPIGISLQSKSRFWLLVRPRVPQSSRRRRDLRVQSSDLRRDVEPTIYRQEAGERSASFSCNQALRALSESLLTLLNSTPTFVPRVHAGITSISSLWLD